MANVDKQVGAKPVKYMNGTPWNGKVTVYYKTGGNAIYKGSFVKASGSGNTAATVKGIDLAGAGDPIIGVAWTFGTEKQIAADPTSTGRLYCPASTNMYIGVIDDVNVLFEIQEDNGGPDYLAAADIGQYVPIVTNSAGSTTTGYSSAEIDSDGPTGTIASATVQIVAAVDRCDNSIGSSEAYGKWLVRLAENHLFAAQAAT